MAEPLNLVSWNVHLNAFAYDSSYVVDELERIDRPDVVCLQEYVEGRDTTALEWLDDNNYVYEYLPFAKFPEDQSVSQGVLTAIRKSIDLVSNESRVLREDGPRRFRPFPNIRGVIETVIKLNDDELLNIYNFHSTLPRPYTVDMRKREFEQLLLILDSLPEDRAIILCGDFNFLGFDKRKKQLKEKFAHFSGGLFGKTWNHYPAYSPLAANLDYIFWTEDTLLVQPDLLDKNTSDHRPIRAAIYS